MKGVKFYLEYPSKAAKKKSTKNNDYVGNSGNVIAVLLDKNNNKLTLPDGKCVECVSALWESKNSSVCSSAVHLEYLSDNCKLVSEQVAREIHPKLFTYLDN